MRRFAFALGTLATLLHVSCNALLGEYTVVEGGPAPCSKETEKDDCPDDHECDADYSGDGVCRLTCSESNPCPKWRECSGNFCSEEVGTTCIDDFADCGSGGKCVTIDEDGDAENRPYCSISCSTEDLEACPPSFECIDSTCREID